MVSVFHAEIGTIPSKCESKFVILFDKITTIAAEMEKEIKISRFNKKQTHRCNIETQNVEDYYIRSIHL